MFVKHTLGDNYCILNAGDIHFSYNNAKSLYSELQNYLFNEIEENKDVLDMVVITGDIFHYELKASSEAARYAYAFLGDLIHICNKYKIVLRILKGTASHDCEQLSAVSMMHLHDEYFKVINKAEAEEVFNGFKVLYLPEEYPVDMHEYYKELVFDVPDKEYEFVFFHGTMEFQAFSGQKYESEKAIESAPVWKCEDMIRITRGIVTGGHIHTACNYKNKIFYHGSFSRMAQGEESPKGYNIYDYLSPDDFEVYRIINEGAPEYKQINLNDLIVENSGNIEAVIKDLDKLAGKPEVNYRINMDKQIKEEYPEIHNIIREYIAGKHNIDIKDVVVATPIVSTESVENGVEDTKVEENPMSFLSNISMSLEEKIQKFAVDILKEDVSINDIEMAIANI